MFCSIYVSITQDNIKNININLQKKPENKIIVLRYNRYIRTVNNTITAYLSYGDGRIDTAGEGVLLVDEQLPDI